MADSTSLWMLAYETLPCTCGNALPSYMREANKHFSGCPKDEVDDVAALLLQVYNSALEDAAKACDCEAGQWRIDDREHWAAGFQDGIMECASAIRSLKVPEGQK